jgi:transcription elongation factor SPT6
MSKKQDLKNQNKKHHQHVKAESDFDEDEEEEDEDGEYQMDDFLVGDDVDDRAEEESESSNYESDEEEDNFELDEDDLELLNKNKKGKLKKAGQKIKREDDDLLEERSKNHEEYNQYDEVDEQNESRIKSKKQQVPLKKLSKSIKQDKEELPKTEIIKKLNQLYGKEELEEEYITDKDYLIKKLDFPERYLRHLDESKLIEIEKLVASELPVTQLALSQSEIMAEAEFIFDKLKGNKSNFDNQTKVKEKIKVVLNHMKNEFFEIPFIALYRKMNYEPELNQADIWKIQEYDLEWMKLKVQKESCRKAFKQLSVLKIENEEHLNKRYIDNCRSLSDLSYINSFISFIKKYYSEELEAINSQFNSKVKIKEEGDFMEDEQHEESAVLHKRPIKKRNVPKKYKDLMINIGRSFSLSVNQLNDNFEKMKFGQSEMNKTHSPNEPELDPPEFVKQHLNDYYDNPLELMKTVINFLAEEILYYPPLRYLLFQILRAYGKISTTPTELGLKEIDIFNSSFRIKRLKDKPINSFNSDLFLDIVKAEKEGYITYSIDFSETKLSDISSKLKQCYFNNEKINENTKKWNLVREEVIKILINLSKNEFKKEIVVDLIAEAEKYVIDQTSNNFFSLLMTGPYKKQMPSIHKSLYFEESPKTLSLVVNPENDIVYSAMLDEYGEIKDAQTFLFLLGRIDMKVESTSESLDAEKVKLKEIFDKYSPDLVVIGANHIKSKTLKENISLIISDFTRESYWVTFGDLTIPYIFSTSSIADSKYSNFNNFTRQAISMGRFKQNPLAETLQLWSEDVNNNICLSLALHPFQKSVNQIKLMEAMELEAIKAVNLNGVDLNRIKDHYHLRKQLSFVSGLGPRKSIQMIEKVTLVGELINRNDIKLYFGACITTNCCGFIKMKQYLALQTNSNGNTMSYNFTQKIILSSNLNRHTNLLDMTRIHPEMYHFAMKTIKAATDGYKGPNSDNSRIEHILLYPETLNELDTNEYIKQQEEQGNYKFKPVLEFIIDELTKPFYDPRKNHKDLAEYDLFKLITLENPIEIGHIILARVTKVTKTHVFCKLDNDLEGSLWKNDIFDTQEDDEESKMNELYPKNSLFYARVKGINKSTFKVDLVTKPSKLVNHKDELKVSSIDECFIIDETEDFKNPFFKNVSESQQIRKYTKRNINHPMFRNFNYKQTLDYFKSKSNGDYIFRPSSKSSNIITLSWKVYEGIISNIQIIEDEKTPGASVGSKLRISNDSYSSLPEIVERYIKPCDRLVKENIENRKFIYFQSIDEMEIKLKLDKANDPVYIHYIFTLSPEYPQYFIMAYIPKQNQIIKEFIKIKPRGLFFHDEYFFDLNELSSYFKANYTTDKYKGYVRKTKPPNAEISNLDLFNNSSSMKNNTSYLSHKRERTPERNYQGANNSKVDNDDDW